MDWENLRKKGWTKEEIEKAKSVVYSDKAKASIHSQKMNRVLYWSILIIAIIGNFIVGVALIPVLITMSDITVFATVALIAVAFGALFNALIKDIEHVDPKHHIIAGLFLPVFAAIVIYVVVNLANKLVATSTSGIFLTQSTIFIPIIYVVAFMLPYLFTMRKHYW